MDPPEIRNRVLLVGEPELRLPILLHRLRNTGRAPRGDEPPPTFAVFPDRIAGSPVTLLTLTVDAFAARPERPPTPPAADIVVLVYDAANRATLTALRDWHAYFLSAGGARREFAALRIEGELKNAKPQLSEGEALRFLASLALKERDQHLTVKDSYTRDDLDRMLLTLARLSIRLYEARSGVRFCGPRPCPSDCRVGRAPHHHIVRQHALLGREETVMLVDEDDVSGVRMPDGIERGWVRVAMPDESAAAEPKVRRVATPPSGSGARLVARNALTHRGPMREDSGLLTRLDERAEASEGASVISAIVSWFTGGGDEKLKK